jgi:hypothetical protein
MATRDRRKVGDTAKPFSVTVDFQETVNLNGLTKQFSLYNLDMTKVVDNATASALDRTDEAGEDDAPILSVWEIYYEPLTTDVDTPGDYLGLFRILFAGGKPGYYPGEEEYIVIEVVPA